MKKSKVVFTERERRVLIDFHSMTFAVYHRHTVEESGFWCLTDAGEIKIEPKKGKVRYFKIRGIILKSTEQATEQENIILLRDCNNDKVIIFKADGKRIILNFQNHTLIVNQGSTTILDGCWNVSPHGSIVLDPVIGRDGQRKERINLEIEGLILQDEDEENFVLIKKD